MYDFYYNYLKNNYGNKGKLLFTDTDSLCVEIETEDTAGILCKFRNGPIVGIHLDYIQRDHGRSCKIIGEKGTIYWDFKGHSVKMFLAKTKKWKIFSEPTNYQTNQMYIDEIKYFMNSLRKRQATFNAVKAGFKVLNVALSVKRYSKVKEIV